MDSGFCAQCNVMSSVHYYSCIYVHSLDIMQEAPVLNDTLLLEVDKDTNSTFSSFSCAPTRLIVVTF